jgi:hypothetical protein
LFAIFVASVCELRVSPSGRRAFVATPRCCSRSSWPAFVNFVSAHRGRRDLRGNLAVSFAIFVVH